MNLKQKCPECDRVFDLLDEEEADEWYNGHDCEQLYEIVRFRQNGPSEVIQEGMSLEEAQEHCEREDTHGDGWFDGYRRM